jgi:hypothetical protein
VLAHGGWFADTLERIRPQTKFAMLHLDCDLYQSTIEVLHHVFSENRISDGRVVFFDNRNSNRCSPLLGQRRAWRETLEKYRVKFYDCGD